MIVGAFVASLMIGIMMVIVGTLRRSTAIWGWGMALTLIGAMLTFVAWPLIYIDSYMWLTKMEAFYDANRNVYKATAEFRNAVIEYNTCIHKLRRYNATPILSPLFANPRDDLKLIILEE